MHICSLIPGIQLMMLVFPERSFGSKKNTILLTMRHSCIAYALFSDWVLDSRAIIYQDRFEADTRILAGARVIWYGNYWTGVLFPEKTTLGRICCASCCNSQSGNLVN